jgi:fucose 4-O-acetylase-like acetyltransferase
MDKVVAKNLNRNELLDIIKGVAIILVVFGHCIQYGSGSEYLHRLVFFDNTVFKVIYSFHMPLFMLVSGYLFNLSVCRHSFKNILLSRFTTLIIPIFVWSFLTIAIRSIIHNEDIAVFSLIKTYLKTSLTTLWFLWAIFYCSLVVLFVRKIFNDSIYMYIFGFILTFFIPDVLNLHLYKFMYPFFVLAYFYSKNEDCITPWVSKQKASILLFVLGFVFLTMIIFYSNDSYIYTSGYYVLNKNIVRQFFIDIYRLLIGLVGSMLIILIIKISYNKINNTLFIAVSKIGTFSLGIYIISGYIVDWILTKLTYNIISINYLLVFIETTVIIIISLFTTLIIKKFKITRVFLLGGR